MDDVWARIGLIAVVVVVALGVALFQRRRSLNPVRAVDAGDLDPGVYFFSSTGCATCDRARAKLDEALGDSGYTEISWEQDPDPFEEIGVEAVPAVMLVDERGRGRLYTGQPDEAIFNRGSR